MKDNGGYVYPQDTGMCHGNGTFIITGGKTLLDDFAGQAMQALLQIEPTTSKTLSNPDNREYAEWMASDAYAIAEAMIKEKRRREE